MPLPPKTAKLRRTQSHPPTRQQTSQSSTYSHRPQPENPQLVRTATDNTGTTHLRKRRNSGGNEPVSSSQPKRPTLKPTDKDASGSRQATTWMPGGAKPPGGFAKRIRRQGTRKAPQKLPRVASTHNLNTADPAPKSQWEEIQDLIWKKHWPESTERPELEAYKQKNAITDAQWETLLEENASDFFETTLNTFNAGYCEFWLHHTTPHLKDTLLRKNKYKQIRDFIQLYHRIQRTWHNATISGHTTTRLGFLRTFATKAWDDLMCMPGVKLPITVTRHHERLLTIERSNASRVRTPTPELTETEEESSDENSEFSAKLYP